MVIYSRKLTYQIIYDLLSNFHHTFIHLEIGNTVSDNSKNSKKSKHIDYKDLNKEVTKKDRFEVERSIVTMFTTYDNTRYIFYAHVISKFKIEMSYKVSTLGVRFGGNKFHMIVNPDFFRSLNEKNQKAVLEHECKHVIWKHCTIRSYDHLNDHELLNIAMDMAINQTIPHLPDGCIRHNDDMFQMPEKLNTEQYYKLLKEKQKTKEINFDDIETLDDHSEFGAEAELGSKFQDSVARSIVREAAKEAGAHVPTDISEILALHEEESKVNWQEETAGMISHSKIHGKQRTHKKRDKRFRKRYDIKGTKRDYTFDMIVCLDVSGSMSAEEIMAGIAEVKHICELNGASMKLIQIDTEIKGVDEITAETIEISRDGAGGTRMFPAIKYIYDNEIPHTGIVFISDLWVEPVNSWGFVPEVPVFWLGTDKNGFEQFEIDGFDNMRKFDLTAA